MPVTFYECLMACAENDDLVNQYARLSGTNVGRDLRSPLDKAIDTNTGYEAIVQKRLGDELGGFVRFAYEIWQRLPAAERA